MRKLTALLLALVIGGVVVLGSAIPAFSAVPKIFSYQGRLANMDGDLLGSTGTTYYFRFAIFDGATGGTQLWPTGTPATIGLTVQNGVFNVLVGDTSLGFSALTLNFEDNTSMFLAVSVASRSDFSDGETLTPRQRIGSSGYAINADTVRGLAPGTGANNILQLDSSGNIAIAGTATIASLQSTANASSFTINAPVSGTDTGAHTLSLQIDGNTGLSIAATGDGAGGVGARTIELGVSSAADTITIGDANANVAITDADWSISAAGAASFTSLTTSSATTFGATTFTGDVNMSNNLILNVGAAGTDFTSGGGLTLAGLLAANGSIDLGDTAADTITFTGVVDSSIVADNNTRNLGSASTRWATGYFDTVDAVSIAGTITGGSTTNVSWTVNSDAAGSNLEMSSLVFERGTPVINSVLQWNALGDAGRVAGFDDTFLFNFPVGIFSQVSGATATFTGGSVIEYSQPAAHAITQASAFTGLEMDFATNITTSNAATSNQTGIMLTMEDGGASATSTGVSIGGGIDRGIDFSSSTLSSGGAEIYNDTGITIDLASGSGTTLTVTNSGAGVAALSVEGSVSGGAGTFTDLTATGAVTMNDAGADTILIGAAADTVTITSNTLTLDDDNWDITAAGAASFASLNSTPIGATTASTGAFTTLSSTGDLTVSGGDITGTGDESIDIGEATANGITFLIDAAGEVLLTSSALSPSVSDGNALGTTSLMWGDLFLASGGVINLNNGDVTLTHGTNLLTLGGGDLDASNNLIVNIGDAGTDFVSGGGLTLAGTLTANGATAFSGDNAFTLGSAEDIAVTSSPAANATTNPLNIALTSPATAAGQTTVNNAADITLTVGNATGGTGTVRAINVGDVTGDAEVGTLNAISIGTLTGTASTGENAIVIGSGWDADINATTSLDLAIGGTGEVTLTASALSPTTSDSNALGTTALMWSDLFLASGGVINFNNGDVTLTHAADSLSVAGGDFNVAIIDGQTVNIDGDGSPTADILMVGSGDTSVTSGVDGLQITFGTSNASGNVIDITPSFAGGATDALTYTVIDIDAFSPTNAAGTDTVIGISVGPLTDPGANIGSSAIMVSSGWDTGIDLNSNTLVNIGAAGTDFTSTGGLTLDDILTVNDDMDVNLAAGENISVLASAASTADIVTISNSGQVSATSGVDGLQITFGSSNASGNVIGITPSYAGGATDALTYTVFDVAAFSPTNAAGTDTVLGISVGTLTDPGATITSGALSIGSGWDAALMLLAAADFDIIDNTANALTITEAGNMYLGIDTTNTATALTIDLPVAGSSTTTGNLFTSNIAKTINIGTGTASDTINLGTGATNANTINIGTGAVANTITIGSGSSATVSITDNNWSITAGGVATLTGLTADGQFDVDIDDNTSSAYHISEGANDYMMISTVNASETIFIGGAAFAKTINIGASTSADTINIGTNATTAETITIGNTNSTSSLDLAILDATATEALCHATDDNVGTVVEDLIDCSGSPLADYAEMYPVSPGIEYGELVALGTKEVVTLDGGRIIELVRTTEPYQRTLVGVLSNNYGDFSSTGYNIDEKDNPMPVALVGRVPLKVTDEGGSIALGDYLTSSSTPGYAMKATSGGRIIGMALGSFDGTQGTVMVYLNPTWWDGKVEGGMLQGGQALLDLKEADASRFLVQNDGRTTINTAVSDPDMPIFAVKNNEADRFTILASGDVVLAGTLVFEDTSFAGWARSDSSGMGVVNFSRALSSRPVVQLTPEGDGPIFAVLSRLLTDAQENYIGFEFKTYGISGSVVSAKVHYLVVGSKNQGEVGAAIQGSVAPAMSPPSEPAVEEPAPVAEEPAPAPVSEEPVIEEAASESASAPPVEPVMEEPAPTPDESAPAETVASETPASEPTPESAPVEEPVAEPTISESPPEVAEEPAESSDPTAPSSDGAAPATP